MSEKKFGQANRTPEQVQQNFERDAQNPMPLWRIDNAGFKRPKAEVYERRGIKF
jgi:hypothetical protein